MNRCHLDRAMHRASHVNSLLTLALALALALGLAPHRALAGAVSRDDLLDGAATANVLGNKGAFSAYSAILQAGDWSTYVAIKNDAGLLISALRCSSEASECSMRGFLSLDVIENGLVSVINSTFPDPQDWIKDRSIPFAYVKIYKGCVAVFSSLGTPTHFINSSTRKFSSRNYVCGPEGSYFDY